MTASVERSPLEEPGQKIVASVTYGLSVAPDAPHDMHRITTIVGGGSGKPHWTDWLWVVGFVVVYLATATGFLYFLRLYLRSIVQP